MEKQQTSVVELLPKIYDHIQVVVSKAFKELIEQLKKDNTQKTSVIDEPYLSAKEASSFLKIKLNTVYSKVEKGELSFYRIGKRKLLFLKKDLEQLVLKTRVKSVEELNEEVDNYKRSKK
jgi:excisionase family DNA binding protein